MAVSSLVFYERCRQANSKPNQLKRQGTFARCSYSVWYRAVSVSRPWIRGLSNGSTPSTGSGRQLPLIIARSRGWWRKSAGDSADETLRQAAAQALPILRNASLRSANAGIKEMARRRLSLVRNALHALAAPRFGTRGVAPMPPSPEEHYRQMLGLPLGRRLAATEIHQAFKRAAKTMHPDGGGNAQDFQALAAARDALMKGQ
jgi:hypothetical protein